MAWTRRTFLSTSAAALAAGLLPLRPLRARSLHRDFQELRRNVGTFTGQGGTIGWLVNDQGAVVVDAQFPDSARTCVDGLAERRPPPFEALINTHHHGDHTAGNPVFRDVTRTIVAHARVPELQRQAARQADTEAEQVYADHTFEESWTLEVGDERIRATHYGPAHTGGDSTITFERANVVHMGDLVFNRVYPFIDRPGGASVRGWIALLEAVAARHDEDTIYVFGHGHPDFGVTGSRADMLVQRDFLAAVLERAERAVREGTPREELIRQERLPDFPDHVAIVERLSLGAALGVAYDELEEGGPGAALD